jgi:ATP-dependent Clp protease ATP-binding subunit ClpX
MRPTEINELLKRDVIGQQDALRFVSVAIFKHLQGEPYGNLMMIGSSGTGKTTIMRAVERIYEEHDELQKYRVVVIINANTFATDEGAVETTRLFTRLEERARRILGDDADPEEIGHYMEHATVCLDEIDKVSGVVGGKPYITGLNIQQALLTLIEGEKVDWTLSSRNGGKRSVVHFNTRNMLFFAAGAFEALYDQVFRRVTSPTSRVKLPNETVLDDGRVEICEYFTLRYHFRQEDLFDYGMLPQFLSRFDNAIILEDLHSELLSQIFTDTRDSVFRASQSFFKKYDIDLEATDGAIRRIADEAAKSARIGARALKAVYGRIIKPFEFDPFAHPEVKANGDRHQLVIDEGMVRKAMRPEV